MTDSIHPRRAVYSALLGGYETATARPVRDGDGVDFIFLTDSDSVRPGDGWNVVKVKPWLESDPVRSARRLKILGHPALQGYDELLWLDNRVQLKVPPTDIFNLLASFSAVFPEHSFRQSLRQEFEEVIASGYDDPLRVRQMYKMAEQAGTLSQRPLWTGMFARRCDDDTDACMALWWEMILLTSRRDQLSLNTAIRATTLNISTLQIDNIESHLHLWLDQRNLQRNAKVQNWSRTESSPLLASFDLLRRTRWGRRALRVLSKFSLTAPTLP